MAPVLLIDFDVWDCYYFSLSLGMGADRAFLGC
jgi:hypothetical protein